MDYIHNGKWIGSGKQNDKHNSLPPELFRKQIHIRENLSYATLCITAMGIYEANLNGQKVGNAWFTPGYTHYESYVQYQSYDVTGMLRIGENTLDVTVANGWWLGRIGAKNNNYGDRRGLLAALHLVYEDGSTQIIGTDESWMVTQDTPVRFADFYNGETIDLSCTEESWKFQPAQVLSCRVPEVKPHIGTFVTEDQRLTPVKKQGKIYDFGQNHAGVIRLVVRAAKGTIITIRHAEILGNDGKLFTKNLRRAKQTLTLTCGKNDINEFLPKFTFMGFRYAEVSSTAPIKIQKIESIVLTSYCKPIGNFSCSDEKLNRLQQNVQWGQCSNFLEIPTDCPQRDERMGWCGDIAVFAQTAAFNRDISLFMKKWLNDLRLYQRPNGTIPVTIPENKTYQPTPFPVPIAIWGDAATMVPWAVYRAYGDKELLAEQYDSMKAYTDSVTRAAARFSKGKKQHLWNNNPFQYGDWCAPGESVGKWKKKGKYLSTCFYANSVDIMQKSAKALGKKEDEAYYADLLAKIKDAFASLCVLPDGRLSSEFQSYYACALYFALIPEDKKAAAAKRLAELVRQGEYKIQTGFAGTPYILFALADNGYIEDAYRLLQNEACPGWLYTVNAGATTMWERWDALGADGSIRTDTIPDMVSFNHYAYGAVGDFFYHRVLGLEPVTAGYQEFAVKPIPGGTLTWAEGSLETAYGKIQIRWERKDDHLNLNLTVPENTVCTVTMPNGNIHQVTGGNYQYSTEEQK